jgi:putative hemolysin
MSFAFAVLILGSMAFLGAASAFFSAMETALFSLQPRQVERLRESLPGRAATVDALFANPRRLLSMILLADTMANLPLCLLGLYGLRTWDIVEDMDQAQFWAVALLLFILVAGVCDLLPKVLALRHPERVAHPAIKVLHVLRPALDPVCRWLQTASEKLADLLTPRNARVSLKLTEDEFEALVAVGAEEGSLRAAESEMIQEIIKLGDKTAKDCMTPRVEVFALPDDLSNPEAVAQLRVVRHHRAPIYGETPDDIIGVLDVRKFLLSLENGSDGANAPHYSEIVDPPSYVAETMRALDLMRAFLSRPQGMAIIVDEYGGTEGIVTLADIIEEIVGDAIPSGGEDLYIEQLDEDKLLVGGHARLDDISEHEGFELEQAEGLDTISGLIFNRLGYLPKVGAVLHLPPLKLTVRQASRKRIGEVLIERNASPAPDEKTESGASPGKAPASPGGEH